MNANTNANTTTTITNIEEKFAALRALVAESAKIGAQVSLSKEALNDYFCGAVVVDWKALEAKIGAEIDYHHERSRYVLYPAEPKSAAPAPGGSAQSGENTSGIPATDLNVPIIAGRLEENMQDGAASILEDDAGDVIASEPSGSGSAIGVAAGVCEEEELRQGHDSRMAVKPGDTVFYRNDGSVTLQEGEVKEVIPAIPSSIIYLTHDDFISISSIVAILPRKEGE